MCARNILRCLDCFVPPLFWVRAMFHQFFCVSFQILCASRTGFRSTFFSCYIPWRCTRFYAPEKREVSSNSSKSSSRYGISGELTSFITIQKCTSHSSSIHIFSYASGIYIIVIDYNFIHSNSIHHQMALEYLTHAKIYYSLAIYPKKCCGWSQNKTKQKWQPNKFYDHIIITREIRKLRWLSIISSGIYRFALK